MKKTIYWLSSPITFTLYLVFALLEGAGHLFQEGLHYFEAWCFDYKQSGLIYRGEGIWSSPHKGEEGYE